MTIVKFPTLLVLSFLFLCQFSSWSQVKTVNAYTFSSTSGTYSAITGATTPTFSGTYLPYDDAYATITIPGFYFYYGNVTTPFSTFTINSNGWMCMGTSTISSLYTPISTGSVPYIIAPLGDDLYGNTGGSISYVLTGTAPNRTLTIQWTNFSHYQATGENMNFQVKLHETSNIIDIVYGAFTVNSTNTTQVGLMGSSNADYNNRSATTSWTTTSAGTANSSTITLSSAIFPSSGLTYRWTPSCTAGNSNAGILTLSSANASCPSSAYVTLINSGYTGIINFQTSINGGVSWQNNGPTNAISALTNVQQTISLNSTTMIRVAASCGGTTVFSPTQTFSFTKLGSPTIAITPASVTICDGTSAILTASGGINYLWNTGATTTSISASPSISTIYSVTSTNGSCFETTSRTVNVNPSPTATITGGGLTPSCSGTRTLTGSGGTTYLWSNAATTAAISVTKSSTYSLTVTNSFGCTATASENIAIGDYYYTGSISAADLDMNGRITRDGIETTCASAKTCPGEFTTTGVRDYDIYSFYNNQNTTVCVTTALYSACTGNEAVFAVAYNGSFNPSSLCANYLADIGSSPTPFNTFSFNVNAFSTFYIVVHAVNTGATCGDYKLYVDIPRTATAITTTGISSCQNAILAAVSPGGTSYLWNTGATTASIYPQSTATYSVTVSYGNNGCSQTASKSITVNPVPTATITGGGLTPSCSGTRTLTGSGGTTYLWSNAATTAAISVTKSSTYSLTVTNSFGCTATASENIAIGDYYYTGSIAAADLDMNGRITRDGIETTCASAKTCPGEFTTTGVRDYDIYTFYNNQNTTVCVTTALYSACTGNEAVFAVAYNGSFNPSSLCTNYLADIGSSPTPFNTFSFNVNAFSTFYIVVHAVNTGAACGDYKLYVDIPRTATAITTTGISSCQNAILAAVSPGGTSYLWNTGATTASIYPQSTATYSVTVSYGNNGCSQTASKSITVNPVPTATITGGGLTPSCSGTRTLTGSGGTTYLWSNAATTAAISVTKSSTYSLTVTNSFGCTATASENIAIGDYYYTGSIAAADLDMNGRITRDGIETTCASAKTCPGEFTTTGVRDYDIYTFYNNQNTTVCVTTALYSACIGNEAVFAVAYNGSFNPSSLCTNYLADIGSSPTPFNTFSFNVNAFSTFYIVVHAVNTGATCGDYKLYVDIPRTATTITTTGISSCQNAILAAVSPGGTSYLWNTGATTASIYPQSTTTYTVTVSYGNNGCSQTASKSITVNPVPTATITGGGLTPTCSGTRTLTGSGGATYLWGNAATTAAISVTKSSTYSLTVTNSFGCTATASENIAIGDYYYTGSIAAADLDMNGRITRDGIETSCASAKTCPGEFTTTGVRDYDIYSFYNNQNTTVCVTTALYSACTGNEAVFAVAYNGTFNPSSLCANYLADIGSSPTQFNAFSFNVNAFSTFYIVVHAVNTGATCGNYKLYVDIPRATTAITTTGALCFNNLVATVAPPGNTYLWSNGATTQSINISSLGTYSSTVTYGNVGCTSVAETTISSSFAASAGPDVTVTCTTPSALLTASGGISYKWNTTATTASISVSPSITTTYTVTITNLFGCTVVDAVVVTANKTVPIANAGADVTLTCSSPSTTLTASGGGTYLWNTGQTTASISVSPTTTTNYIVTVTGTNGCKASDAVKVTPAVCHPTLLAKVWLSHVNSSTILMDNYIATLSDFPLSDPYTAAPLSANYTHINNSTVATMNPSLLTITGSSAIIDWVFLELRTGLPGATSVVYTKSGLLQSNGLIVNTDGSSPFIFTNAPTGTYYLSIRHRNSLGFRTLSSYNFIGSPVNLNFSNNSVNLYGGIGLSFVATGIYSMNSGDSNADGSIDAFDTVSWEQQNGLFDSYLLSADYNMDGSVDAFDTILWELNNGKFQELE